MRTRGGWQDIAAAIGRTLGAQLAPAPERDVHGGCIAESVRWQSSAGPLFVKLTPASDAEALEAEADGLEELASAKAVRVPRVLAVGTAGERAFLALEWIELRPGNTTAETELGRRLAQQHRVSAPGFGWHRDNTIGGTPQPNAYDTDWVRFFRERRLRHQLDLARANGYGGALQSRGERLLESMHAFFTGHRPVPSLLHGDLWGGNWSMDEEGHPVIYDPAPYYGDREADIAMTQLFGGFGRAFHAAYQAEWPLDPAAENRRALYNLYHLLNHLNLFGGGYGQQALSSIDRLLAELGH